MNINKEHISNKSWNKKSIYSITPFTILDYPNKTACILWFAGCNMRCVYCYNPEIVLGKGNYSFYDLYNFLASRKGLLDGVVFSGGECLMYSEILDIIMEIKSMDYLIKIDTNGSKPEVIQYLLENQIIDYIALDFKAPISKTMAITKTDFYNKFINTLNLCVNSGIEFEVRTTYHSELLDINDLYQMVNILEQHGYFGKYYLQPFKNNVSTLTNLNHSYFNLNLNWFSSPNIEIVLR